jgi:ferredoxin
MFHDDRCNDCGDCLVSCLYNRYERNRALEEFGALRAGGTPPIVASCDTCGACNQICPLNANPFDLINQRQEESGASEYRLKPWNASRSCTSSPR